MGEIASSARAIQAIMQKKFGGLGENMRQDPDMLEAIGLSVREVDMPMARGREVAVDAPVEANRPRTR